MAYVVITEVEAAAREYSRRIGLALVDCLRANKDILGMASEMIHLGRMAEGRFPAIAVEPLDQREEPETMGGRGHSLREMRLSYRVYGFAARQEGPAAATESILRLADRIRAILVYNETLDGQVRDLRVSDASFGRLPGSYVEGVQMDVTAVMDVVRP